MNYKPSSWFMLVLSKILPAGFTKRFVEVDKLEHAAREEIEQLTERILTEPCNKKHTDKLRKKAQQAAREVLNGAG